MINIRELYQEVITDHNRSPRNHTALSNPTCSAKGYNPLCGDQLLLELEVQDQIIQAVGFQGCGCAISQASASLMTEIIKGKTVQEAHDLFERFRILVTHEGIEDKGLDKLSVLAGVRVFPMRVKCATLAWHTLEAALNQKADLVSTE